jgi:probable F420-dependent oxidoreductase
MVAGAAQAIGQIGIRSRPVGVGDLGAAIEAVQELEELGYGALWLNWEAIAERGDALAAATKRIVIGSSVASIWRYEPADLAAAHRQLADAHPGRFLLGIGISHAPTVERTVPGRVYAKPVASMLAWLDELDACRTPVPRDELVIAAIWPRMLGIARDRSAGAHPYLVPPSHSREARATLGEGPLLAPSHVAFVGADADQAREIARRHVNSPYLTLPNYANNWLRHGFDESDLADGGSDRLIDALVAWGDAETVAEKVREHRDAGADHVGIHLLADDPERLPRAEWRALAAALGLS